MTGTWACWARVAASTLLACCWTLTTPGTSSAQEQARPDPHAGHAPSAPTSAAPAGASSAPGAVPAAIAKPIPLMTKALGPFTRKISSANAEAQAYFTQGMQMMFAFAKVDAIRSFRAAWTADSQCAICYWGEAWAWGSYLNEKMSAEDAPFAYAASRKALDLKKKADPVERDYIDALAVRYVKDFDPEKRRTQDEAYAEAARTLSEKYPDDLDARTLYADALFLLEPRRGRRDVEAPNIKRLHGVLEGILARDPRHPGACHLYVHATESTVRPDKAEACAEYLGKSIPGASHINHMPSHTWNEVGRWGDSVRANLDAVHSDMKADIGEGFAIYPEHNLHMLLYAASMDGQGAIATMAGRDYAKRRRGDTMYQVLTLLRFGRFDEILATGTRPERPIPGGMWDFAQGYAYLRTGQADMAAVYLGRVRKGAETPKAEFRDHPASRLLGLVGDLLEGEILREQKQLEAAMAKFESAVALDDALEYDEPEPLPFAARHWLGAALIEAGRFADAERVYREDLKQHPRNGWSLLGLKQAIEGQGRHDAAVDADLEKAWARADTWTRASRF
jgi:tetratricopeptide (TPR) repeat protein